MNAVDATDREAQNDTSVPASLLTIILDTHPAAWSLLSSELPLSKLLANLLVFINAHLAISNANRVAVIASHVQRAQWLYPTPSPPASDTSDKTSPNRSRPAENPNKYRPFAHIEHTLTTNLHALLDSTTPADLTSTPSTLISGALTMALAYISKLTLAAPTQASGPTYDSAAGSFTAPPDPSNPSSTVDPTRSLHQGLTSRLLILSVSGDLSSQYIPLMNAIFACQRLHVPIDILKLAGDTVFLQQAADATGGVYLSLAAPPAPSPTTSSANGGQDDAAAVEARTKRAGVLQYLLQAFLPDPSARHHLCLPGQATGVDFRAACFCHRRIVDIGFVCSICLSIFCEPLLGGDDGQGGSACLTCGTDLQLGNYGTKPVVVARKKKVKKKRMALGDGRAGTPMSGPGTPAA